MADLEGFGQLPDLEGFGVLTWDSRTERPVGQAVGVPFQQAVNASRPLAMAFQQGRQLSAPHLARWADAAPMGAPASVRFQDDTELGNRTAMRYQDAVPRGGHGVASRFQDTLRQQSPRTAARFQDAIATPGIVRRIRYQDSIAIFARVIARYQDAVPITVRVAGRFNVAKVLHRPNRARYQDAIQPGIGITIPPEGPVDPEEPEPGATIVVPVRRAYVTINTLSLRRVDTDQALLAYDFNLQVDADSWTWTWSASVRGDALVHVRRAPGADPIVVETILNGAPYRFQIERVARDRKFPSTRLQVSGRGLSAILASPHVATQTFSTSSAMTAAQLLDDVLTVNGVSLGWEVDFELEDWPVPAGAWTIQGSYMDAVTDIAAAAGGYVQPHPTGQILRILPRYPVAPWAWGAVTPDIELPASPVEVEATEWLDMPAYNRVFVGGTGAGVFGPVTRVGSAGDLVAPQVAHALITDVIAQRQRGLAELANTGRQAHLQLTLPVLPETGLILPGRFIRYVGPETSIGIVRSTSYNWSTKRQTLGVETHVA